MKFDDLEVGMELTLLELDLLVEEKINDDEMETPLINFSAKDLLDEGNYLFYLNNREEIPHRLEFDVVSDFRDEDTIIKITRIQLWC